MRSAITPRDFVEHGQRHYGAAKWPRPDVPGPSIPWAIYPQLKLVAGVFDVRKPYFNTDETNAYVVLGDVRHRGAEFSLTGTPTEDISLVAGAVLMQPRVTGEAVEQGRVVAVHEAGQPVDFAKFIPRDRGVVLATRDGAISIWRPILSREDRLLRAANARAPRGLSPSEQLELGLTNATPIWKRLHTQLRAWAKLQVKAA